MAICELGKTYGRWYVVSSAGRDKWYCDLWCVVCQCGAHKKIKGASLRTGVSKSCGCLRKELAAAQFTMHGMHNTPTYASWEAMVQRCTNPKNAKFRWYGGRGILVCKRWLGSFENFFKDMGRRPKGKTLDRMDSSRNYEPSNCRWATWEQQVATRRPRGKKEEYA
jgi:hypothetical protein